MRKMKRRIRRMTIRIPPVKKKAPGTEDASTTTPGERTA
jgi:hypothetical protein